MTAEPRWDSTRWRDAAQTPRYETLQQYPPNLATQDTAPGMTTSQSWYGSPHDQRQQHAYDSRRSSQTVSASYSQYAPEQRVSSSSCSAQNTSSFLNGDSYTGNWKSEPSQATGKTDNRGTEGPLSLQIPRQSSELPRMAHGYTTPRSDAPTYSGGTNPWSNQTTSLPPFAALSEQATRTDEPDDVEIAPMSARISCAECTKLGPLIREVATGVVELDGHAQSLCNRVASRSPEIPKESAVRTVQWILDRMRYTKRDMQDVTRYGSIDRSQSQAPQYSNPLKRTAEQWDQDDMPILKLPRPDAPYADTMPRERRGSIDFATRDFTSRPAYSPAPSDSAPDSSYQRQGSPVSGRLLRALPSPSSLAFPPSASASFVPANAASVGSPGTSYHPGSSIHTVSTNSATSAHLQDLQHQVSLKSLALQTLQTEYATLLQKLQRERIKSQTIEKKTTVADQEVNDLTTRNEDLAEQIRTLEASLQDSERRRESERADAAKEKDQWSRMLDMSGRLQSKNAADRQRLAKENADLLYRLSVHEPQVSAQGDRSGSGQSQGVPLQRPSGASPLTISDEGTSTKLSRSGMPIASDVDALRRENTSLQAKVATLRSSLEDFRLQYEALEKIINHLNVRRDLLRKTVDESTSGNGLGKGNGTGSNPQQRSHDDPSSPKLPTSRAEPTTQSRVNESPLRPQETFPGAAKGKQSEAGQADPLSPENLAHIARAVSPGPAELGFYVQPSTSSPEELIKALGPVPAPFSSTRFYPSPFENTAPSTASGPSQRRRQSQPFVAPLSVPHEVDDGLAQLPSFRPLNQHGPPAYTQPGASPHSYHSSPGPNQSSSSSFGSTPAHSPEYWISGGEYNPTRRHSQAQLPLASSSTTAAMPPPPRPLP